MPEPNPTNVKELLDTALPAQSPPTALHREALVAAGRRSLRRRRLVTAVGAVAAVAVLAGGVAGAAQFLPGQLARGHQVVPGGPRASASVAPSPTDNPDIPPAARFTTALRKQVTAFLPDAKLSSGEAPLRDVEPLGFVMRQGTWYEAGAGITTSAGVGGLVIGVMPDATGVGETACGKNPMEAGDQCTTMTVAGTTLHKHTHTYSTGAQWVDVEGLLPDGSYIWIQVYDYDPASVPMVKYPPAPTPTLSGLPLSADQQAAIVTNPDFRSP
jgi:hypothetical protein